MPKKEAGKAGKRGREGTMNREEKILNIIGNILVLLMALMTDAFSEAFTEMAEGMAQVIAPLDDEKKLMKTGKTKREKTGIPKQLMDHIIQMKADVKGQLQAKMRVIRKTVTDPRFDTGIRIAEQYDFGVPNLTYDLDEASLLTYISLLKANDAQCTRMFQELMEWMKTIEG